MKKEKQQQQAKKEESKEAAEALVDEEASASNSAAVEASESSTAVAASTQDEEDVSKHQDGTREQKKKKKKSLKKKKPQQHEALEPSSPAAPFSAAKAAAATRRTTGGATEALEPSSPAPPTARATKQVLNPTTQSSPNGSSKQAVHRPSSPSRTSGSTNTKQQQGKTTKQQQQQKSPNKPRVSAPTVMEPGAVAVTSGSDHQGASSPYSTPTQRVKGAVPRASPRTPQSTAAQAEKSLPPMPVLGHYKPPGASQHQNTWQAKREVGGGGGGAPLRQQQQQASPRPSPSQSKELWGNRGNAAAATAAVSTGAVGRSVMPNAPDSPMTHAVREQGLVHAVSLPAVGAFAVDQPAPVYIMPDEEQPHEDGNDWERWNEESNDDNDNDNENEDLIFDADVEPAPKPPEATAVDEGFCAGKRRWIAMTAVALLVVLIITIVVVVVVTAGGGDDPSPAPPATAPPTPTVAPTAKPPEPFSDICFSNTRALMNQLRGRINYNNWVDVQLCPRTSFDVIQISRSSPWSGTWPALNAQSNMRLKCGPNGDLTDRCIVSGEDGGQTLLFNSVWFATETAARNVTFEGITFESGKQTLMELTNGGDVTFKNCLFRKMAEFNPIFINFQPEDSDPPNLRQTVTFEGCIFEDLQYGPPIVTTDEGSFYRGGAVNETGIASVVLATYSANTVIFRDCIFRNNRVSGGNLGHYITSLGAEVQVQQTCFYENTIGISGSPILFTGTPILTSASDIFVEGNWECGLAAQRQPGGNLTCEALPDATECLSSTKDFSAFW